MSAKNRSSFRNTTQSRGPGLIERNAKKRVGPLRSASSRNCATSVTFTDAVSTIRNQGRVVGAETAWVTICVGCTLIRATVGGCAVSTAVGTAVAVAAT